MAKEYWKVSSKILPGQTDKDLRSLAFMTDTPTKTQIKFLEPHAHSHAVNKLLHVSKVYLSKHH